ncbi:hypothetical protein BDN72DRAFT_899283 [Pluteus cervinus]|uniref:Uncharacterized protein n=1 Tax=Pluteus cervinus TaxID=181527 RepID=A0ACD3AMY3_9AGAR|nr:hypothetical protein BDN72DRAFT_899283 [Pluteus cervinus]
MDAPNEDMSILATAFDITAVTHLTCTFKTTTVFRDQASMKQYTWKYTRLARFIQRMTHVDKIVLRLERLNIFGEHHSKSEKHDAWAESLNLLLNACVERGCKDLEVWDGSWLELDFKVVRVQRSRITMVWLWLVAIALALVDFIRHIRLLNSTSSSLATISRSPSTISPTWSTKEWKFEALTIPGPRILEASLSRTTRSPSITGLFISTPSLLLPPHSLWLYQLFRCTTLTTLTLHQIQLHQWYWEASLSWMTNSHLHASLEDLTISGCSTLPKNSLVRFINRLKKLRRLTLSYPLPQFRIAEDTAIEEKLINLPKLQEVSAPLDFISILTPGRATIHSSSKFKSV